MLNDSTTSDAGGTAADGGGKRFAVRFADWLDATVAALSADGVAYRIAVGAIFALLALFIATTYNQYGFNIDEDNGYSRALQLYEFYASDLPFAERLAAYKASTYGAVPELMALLVQKTFPVTGFDSRHLVAALFGLVGIWFTYLIALSFVGRLPAFFTLLLMATSPGWLGYMFLNLKDIPYAAALVASYYFCMRALTGRETKPWLFVAIALASGMLATTKLIGILMLGLFCALTLPFLLWPRPAPLAPSVALVVRILLIAAASAVGTIVFQFLFMPQTYTFDAAVILKSITRYMNFESWNGKVLIFGRQIPAENTPWYYLTVYLIISTPLHAILLFFAGVVLIWRDLNRIVMGCVAIICFFLIYQMVTGARVYNGYRHFVFLLPMFAIVAGAGAAGLLGKIQRWPRIRLLAAAAIITGVGTTIVSIQRLYPYQYSYYNSLVGGLSGADGLFYVDVWRTAAREAWIELDQMGALQGRTLYVASCDSRLNSRPLTHVLRIGKAAEADFVIIGRRGCTTDLVRGMEKVRSITRDGVELASIYRNDKPKKKKADPAPTAATN